MCERRREGGRERGSLCELVCEGRGRGAPAGGEPGRAALCACVCVCVCGEGGVLVRGCCPPAPGGAGAARSAPSRGEPEPAVRAARRSPPVPARRGEIATSLPRCMCEEMPILFFFCMRVCVSTQGLFLSLQVQASDIPRKSLLLILEKSEISRNRLFIPLVGTGGLGRGVRTLERTLSWDFPSPSPLPPLSRETSRAIRPTSGKALWLRRPSPFPLH